MYNLNPYNVLWAIATNILQRLKTGFVLQIKKINKSKDTLNVKLEPPVGVSKSLISESLRLNGII